MCSRLESHLKLWKLTKYQFPGLSVHFVFFGLLLIQIFDINVKSAFLLAKDVVPLMKKRGFVYWVPIWDIGIGGTIV